MKLHNWFVIIFLVISPGYASDFILLKDASSFEGRILSCSGSHIKVQIPYGEMSIPVSSVQDVVLEEEKEACSYKDTKDYEPAIKIYNRLIKENSGFRNQILYWKLACCYQNNNQVKIAESIFYSLLKTPDFIFYHLVFFRFAEIQKRHGNFKKACDILSGILKAPFDEEIKSRVFLEQAGLLLEDNQYLQAKEIIVQLVLDYPNTLSAKEGRRVIQKIKNKEKDIREIENIFYQIKKIAGKRFHYELLKAYSPLIETAFTIYQKNTCKEIQMWALEAVIECYYRQAEYGKMNEIFERYLRESVEMDQENWSLKIAKKGFYYYNRCDFYLSIPFFEFLMQKEFYSPDTIEALDICYQKTYQHCKRIEMFEILLKNKSVAGDASFECVVNNGISVVGSHYFMKKYYERIRKVFLPLYESLKNSTANQSEILSKLDIYLTLCSRHSTGFLHESQPEVVKIR